MSKVLEGLNKEQKEAVGHGEGPLLIVAGAGTGKTTVITRRIAYLIEQGVKPGEILAMAFGDKAALEMEERVDQLLPLGYYDLQISTFHAFGERLLKEYGLAIGLPDFKVLDEAGQWLLIRNNLDKFDLDYYRPLGNPTRFIRALVSHFSRCKDELITPEEYLQYAEKVKLNQDSAESGSGLSPTPSQSPPISGDAGAGGEIDRVQEVANAYHVYQRLLLQNNALDFGDLINYSLKLFKERPAILGKLRQQYQYILIDEFQDTNLAQYELIKLLAAPLNNLTVVGDDDQSIFKFRGASISNIMHFKRDYPKAKSVSLTQNYRSTQKILDKAYEFIRQNDPDRLEVKLGISKKLISTPSQSPPSHGGEIRVLEAEDYVKEAEMVVGQILEIMGDRGDKGMESGWNDFAILARSHDALEPFINALESAKIPYIYFANRGLYKKSVILDALAYFNLLENYHDNAAMYRVMKMPVWGIADRALIEASHLAKKKAVSLYEVLNLTPALSVIGEGGRKLLAVLEKHSKAARHQNVGQLFAEIVADLEISKKISPDNAKYLEQFYKKIQNFENESADRHLRAFLEAIRFEMLAGEQGKLEQDPEAGPEAVKLMTVHGAKGLEFRTVFVAGLVDKRFPSIERREQVEIPEALVREVLPEGDAHLMEERRLFYVAMTRAKQNLLLTRARDYGGKTTKKPSRFLVELGMAKEKKTKPTGKVSFRPQKTKAALPLPTSFSHSQISDFISCPLRYKYRHVLKLPEAGSGSLSFGNTIHTTFDKFLRLVKQRAMQRDLFTNLSPSPSPSPGEGRVTLPKFDVLEKLYEASWIDDWYESAANKKEFREKGRRVLKDFYADFAAHPPQVKYLEEWFRLPVKQGIFRGKIDRADESGDGLIIIDYKTGKTRPIEKVDKQQLLIYQWAAMDFFKQDVADLQYWFFEDKLEKVSFLGKETDIKELKAELEETIAEIIQATKENSFYERDLRTSHREECRYRDLE